MDSGLMWMGAYDLEDSEVNTFNLQASYELQDGTSLSGEYRGCA